MTTYKTIIKDENTYRIIQQEAKNKKEFIKNLRGNGFKATEMKVKTKELFDRAMDLIGYVGSKEEAEIIWKYIKSVDDTVQTITERILNI